MYFSTPFVVLCYAVPATGSRQTILIGSREHSPEISRQQAVSGPGDCRDGSKSSSRLSACMVFISGEIRKNGPDG